MAREVPKLVSKLYRLRLTDEIEYIVRVLPFRDLVETQVGNHIYMADGKIRIGSREYPGRIRIWIDDGRVRAAVRAASAGLKVETELEELPEAVRNASRKCFN